MLIGRATELARIDASLEALRDGRGGAILLRGMAGIGKSALLAAARERAEGMTVLTVAGHETEADLPFSGLGELLGPILANVDTIPVPQAVAVRGALALEPPVPGDRYAVCAGALAMLVQERQAGPLLVLIDDLHWLDQPSRGCLTFIARRAARAGILLIAAERPATTADHDVPFPGEVLVVGALEPGDAEALLRARAPSVAPSARRALLRTAAGVPLGILELPMGAGGAADDDPSVAPPVPPGDRIAQVFAGRVAGVSPVVRLALLLIAASEPADLGGIVPAATQLGIGSDAVEAAGSSGLVELSGHRATWTHPLARSVIYHAATPEQRRRVHRALATVSEGDARAWHLALGALGPDTEAAAAMELAAASAASRRADATASEAYERSARLLLPGPIRAERLMRAGAAAGAAGDGIRAITLLDEALDGATDPVLTAAVERERGNVMVWTDPTGAARRRLSEAAEAVATRAPGLAAAMLADAAIAQTTNDCRGGWQTARRAAALLPPDAPTLLAGHVLAALGWAEVLVGERDAADATYARVHGLLAQTDPTSPGAAGLTVALLTRMMLVEPAAARPQLLGLAAALRQAGALSSLPYVAGLAMLAGLWTGAWDAAETEAMEVVALAEETGVFPSLGWAVALLARLHAMRGRVAEAQAGLTRADSLAEQTGLMTIAAFAASARGVLDLSQGRPADAAHGLEALRSRLDDAGLVEPALVPFGADLVEAHARAGNPAAATIALEWLATQAKASGRRWAMGAVERCRGLLGDGDPDDRFARALELHDPSMPFERARTQLVHGEVLRRSRRPADAREALHAALEGFGALGAVPWADRARAELHAAGGLVRRPSTGLTDAEDRVARAAARGLTNREIAQELFLSPRTVEAHLQRAFRKLDIHSRSMLIATMAREEPVD